MKSATLTATSLLTIAALFFPGCTGYEPGQSGPFADGATAGGDLARSANTQGAETLATGAPTSAIGAATIVILAKRPATERQRTVAVARARVAVERIKRRQARAAAPEPKPRPAKKIASTPEKKKPTVEAKPKPAPQKIPRYIAVDTVKDERTVPAAKKTIVIFDTETQEIVGNNVYDVKSTPPVGTIRKFETYTAEYVGGGGGGG